MLAIVLWCVEDYQYYAGCIFAVSAVSLVMETVETRRNMVALRAMIARTDTVQVVRRTSAGLETTKTIDTDRLLPGDVFVVQPGMHVPADAVLVQGGCLVNESMLTGESLPINKTELPPDGGEGPYSPVLHKAHTLFRGTKVVQNRAQMTRGLVVRTGFSTAKGDLIRSILFPNESQFRFYRDGLRFLGFMSVLAVLGFVYTVVLMWHYGVSPGAIAVRGLDLVTTVVPPALPAAMTVGTIYAVARLKKRTPLSPFVRLPVRHTALLRPAPCAPLLPSCFSAGASFPPPGVFAGAYCVLPSAVRRSHLLHIAAASQRCREGETGGLRQDGDAHRGWSPPVARLPGGWLPPPQVGCLAARRAAGRRPGHGVCVLPLARLVPRCVDGRGRAARGSDGAR